MKRYWKILNEIIQKNRTLIKDKYGQTQLAINNRVNINWWHIKYGDREQNLGDMLSEVVVNYMCNANSVDMHDKVKSIKHLYAIGSILFFGQQDATVWGTGTLGDVEPSLKNRIKHSILRKLDVRAVRGPLTRDLLLKMGIKCPEVYGDPAVLLPLFYKPNIKSEYNKVLVLSHIDEDDNLVGNNDVDVCSMKCIDWKTNIDKIASAKYVLSSSLHGIIIAESYGVPAIFLKGKKENNIFKYKDYYYSTGRNEIPIVNNIEEGLNFDGHKLGQVDFTMMQKNLMESFPVDLWK